MHCRPQHGWRRSSARLLRRAVASSTAGKSAPERLIAATEELLAEGGIEKASVRQIAAAASVQLSTIGYYFGSKEQLIEAVFEKSTLPMLKTRQQLLDACAPEALGRAPTIRELVIAYCDPVFMLASEPGGERALQVQRQVLLISRERSDKVRAKYYAEGGKRFIALFQHAYPDLPVESVYCQFNLLVSALFASVRDLTGVKSLSYGEVQLDIAILRHEFVEFMVAGWEARTRSITQQLNGQE